jgi:hypothetical protein
MQQLPTHALLVKYFYTYLLLVLNLELQLPHDSIYLNSIKLLEPVLRKIIQLMHLKSYQVRLTSVVNELLMILFTENSFVEFNKTLENKIFILHGFFYI